MHGVPRPVAALPAIAAIFVVAAGLLNAQQKSTQQAKKGAKPSTQKKSQPTRGKTKKKTTTGGKGKSKSKSRVFRKKRSSTVSYANYALVGGTVLSQSKLGNFRGNIIIRNGRIVDAGPKAAVPKGLPTIDARGTFITPGFIDAQSSLWLTPRSRRAKSSSGSLDVLDGIDQFSDDWWEVVRHGVTSVYVAPQGVLGGNGCLLRVGSGSRMSQLVLRPVAAVQASFGVESGSGSSHYNTVRGALSSAKRAMKRRLNPLTRTRNHARILAREVLRRRVPLLIEAHKAKDISNALKLADEFKAKLILSGVSDPGDALDKLRQRRVPLIVGPLVETEGTAPTYRRNRKAKWLQELLKENPKWALGTFSKHVRGSKFLRVQAAAAIAAGISPKRVLRALTIDAATMLGYSSQIGSIEKGKYADLVMFLGDPLDPAVPVYRAFAKGQLVYRSRKVARRPRLKRLGIRGLPKNLAGSYAVRSTRFLSRSGVAKRTMVVQKGVITAIGPTTSTKVPAGLPIYDVGQSVVTAGLVAAQTTLNLTGDSDGATSSDELHIRASDAFDPQNAQAQKLAKDGFLSLGFSPGSKNVVAGSIGVVRPAAQPCVLSGRVASKFVLTSASRNRSRFPASLSGQTLLVSSALRGNGPAGNVFLPPPVLRQLRCDRIKEVRALRGKQRVALFEANSAAEVSAAIRLTEAYKLKASIYGTPDLRPYALTMRRLRIGLVIPPVSPSTYDRYTAQYADLANRGMALGFSAGNGKHIRASLALMIRLGMRRSAAVAALTSGAARSMGMPSWVGQLTKGGRADFVVWTGSPLDLASRPLTIVCDGKPVSQKNE